MDLKVAHIEYSITTKSLDIFIVGCYGNCKGCCNPEIKDFNAKGMSLENTVLKLRELYQNFSGLIDKFIIVGGDPVDAELKTNAVSILLEDIKMFSDKPIYLFTRHKLDEIPESLKNISDYIKTGPYIPELKTERNIQFGIKLATSNQNIYKKIDNKWIGDNNVTKNN